MYQALYRKYRPRTFADVAGQSHITDTLRAQLAAGRSSHAYLFTGSRGTGKTTCAKILAKAVNCEAPVNGEPCNHCASCVGIDNGSILDVLEIDAASNNGVDNVRALRDEANYTPAAVKKRVYIIDEVHMLSTAAFNALLKIMEEPPEHLLFILATTELHKVPATILSRCQRYAFKRLSPADIAERLLYVAGQEGMELSRDAAALLARLADGAMRDGLSLLDQCASGGRSIDREAVLSSLGLAGSEGVLELMDAISKRQIVDALGCFAELYAAGKSVAPMLDELALTFRDLLMIKTVKEPEGLITAGSDIKALAGLAEMFTPAELIRSTELIRAAIASLPKSGSGRTEAELCLMRLCDPSLSGDISALEARISRLEAGAVFGGGAVPTGRASAPQKQAPAPKRQDAPPPPEDDDAPPPAEGASGEQDAAPAPESSFWQDILKNLKPPKIEVLENIALTKPALTTAQLEGDTLRVQVGEEYYLHILNNDKLRAALTECACAVLGRPVSVRIEGKGEDDPLGALLSFGAKHDNIKIKN